MHPVFSMGAIDKLPDCALRCAGYAGRRVNQPTRRKQIHEEKTGAPQCVRRVGRTGEFLVSRGFSPLAKIAYRRNTDRELRFVIAAWGEMDLGLGSCRNNSVGWCGDRRHRFSTGRIPRSARPRLDMMITPARDLSEQFPTRSQAVARGFLISIVMCTCRIIPGIRQPDRP
jgi:hypothetical protein